MRSVKEVTCRGPQHAPEVHTWRWCSPCGSKENHKTIFCERALCFGTKQKEMGFCDNVKWVWRPWFSTIVTIITIITMMKGIHASLYLQEFILYGERTAGSAIIFTCIFFNLIWFNLIQFNLMLVYIWRGIWSIAGSSSNFTSIF